jgi:hypothetical protein
MSRNHDINSRDFEDLLDKQFLGIIVDIDDPRKEGRAKVRVASIYDEIPVEDIPWAFPKNRGTVFGQAGKGGAVSIPKLNSVVGVVFDNGNPYSPEFFSLQELADDVKGELDTEYAGSHIVLFDGDQELKLWFSVSKGLTLSVKGASINLAPDNLITVKTDNKVVIDSPNIELGATTSAAISEYVLKGETFLQLFNSHVHPSAGAPPTPPLIADVVISKTTKTK